MHAATARYLDGKLRRKCTLSESDSSKFKLASFETQDNFAADAWFNYQCYDDTGSLVSLLIGLLTLICT